MKYIGRIIAMSGTVLLIGCGGGGGGSSTGNYTGTWDVRAVRVINDCGVAISSTWVNTIVVNQDGSRVVVNSGSRVLEGALNDKDGFTVTDNLPGSNGCSVGAGYVFTNASDGEAEVGVALLARCGARECAVAYGGSGIRRSQKALASREAPSINQDEVLRALEEKIASGNGDVGQGSVEESTANLAELAAPAS
jgi:hypothetical protein